MGKLLSAAMAGMFAFFLVTMMAASFYNASDDTTKENFTLYRQYEGWSDLDDNLSVDNTNSTVSNMQLQAEVIANKITDAQVQLSSNDITQQLLGAFGIISALTIDIVFLLLFVMLDGVNFIGGIAFNLSALPTPWNYFAVFGGFGIALFIVYTVLKIAAAILKWDI